MPYKIINWAEHQARNDRGNNPWVKLKKSILTSRDFFSLPLDRRWEWPLLWCLAEHATGIIRLSDEEIGFKLRYDSGKVWSPNVFIGSMLEKVDTSGVPVVTSGPLEKRREEERREEERRGDKKPHSAKPRAASVCGNEKNHFGFPRVWKVWRGHGWSGRRKAEALLRFSDLCKREPKKDWITIFVLAFDSQAKGLALQKRIEDFAPRQPDLCVWIEDKKGGGGERWLDEPYTAPGPRPQDIEPHRRDDAPSLSASDEEHAKYLGVSVEEYRRVRAREADEAQARRVASNIAAKGGGTTGETPEPLDASGVVGGAG